MPRFIRRAFGPREHRLAISRSDRLFKATVVASVLARTCWGKSYDFAYSEMVKSFGGFAKYRKNIE